MTYARKTLVSLNDTPYYWWKLAPALLTQMDVGNAGVAGAFTCHHFRDPWRSHVVARCVRRAWLWAFRRARFWHTHRFLGILAS